MSSGLNPNNIQGNILRGYRRSLVRHLMLEVADRASACAFLQAAATGGDSATPAITTESETRWSRQPDGAKPESCFNIGVTHAGLKALGVPAESLATFPTEFAEGMAQRALKLGDFGDSAPANWAAPFDRPGRIHIIASIYADDSSNLDRIQAQVTRAFTLRGTLDGRNLPENRVFFNYVDSISQPRFAGIHDADQAGVNEPFDPIGTALLGYPTKLEGLMFRIPTPSVLGYNGSFNAFRVLAQDCAGFENYLTDAAETLHALPDEDIFLPTGADQLTGPARKAALREIVAAQFCGRWRANGAPFSTAPNGPGSISPEPPGFRTNFDYTRSSACPAGAHIRRANPRGGPVVQRISSRTRRIIRRGMVYGPDFDPTHPDTAERGLLGNFIGASLGAQFEAVMYDWVNLGLQDPHLTGSNDPLIGANTPETSWFDFRLRSGNIFRLRGLPRFVKTRGGAYTFLPSLPAIAYIAASK